MKGRGKLLGTLFLAIMMSSCSLESLKENLMATGESGYNYTESRSQWVRLRDAHKNTYHYSILELSVTNNGNETTIRVKKGKVVDREYLAFIVSQEDGSREVISSWAENKHELGTHPEGAPPVTIDELYDTCLADYLSVDEESNTIYFDTDGAGVISLCGFVPDLCQDDCFVGFDISSFSWDKK